MIAHPRIHKVVVLIAACAMFACVAALLSVNLTSPTSAALGADWQCSRFALVFTSCSSGARPRGRFHWLAKADLVHDKTNFRRRFSI